MRVARVWLTDFRNYVTAEVEPAPGLTAIVGVPWWQRGSAFALILWCVCCLPLLAMQLLALKTHFSTAAAFAFDREALALTVEGMQLAADVALDPIERVFFYLPLEHAESLEVQNAAVEAFDRLVREAPAELRGYCEYCGKYARQHRDIIAKFGRFPHRNRILDRESTPVELEWLSSGGATFGQ